MRTFGKTLLTIASVSTVFVFSQTQTFAQSKQVKEIVGCKERPYFFTDRVKNFESKRVGKKVDNRYFDQLILGWNARYFIEACKRKRAGENVDFCLNGKRPLAEIAEDVPADLYDSGFNHFIAAVGKIRAKNLGVMNEARDICSDLGYRI